MSHVDEAKVSAYVDEDASLSDSERREIEVHLSSCSTCRDLVANARATRDVARSILARSGPDSIAAPAFEDLLALSRQRTNRRRTRFTWSHGIAAAAVLTLAVSVGIFSGRVNLVLNNRNITSAPATARDESAIGALRDAPATAVTELAANQPALTEPTESEQGVIADRMAAASGAARRSGVVQPPSPGAGETRQAAGAVSQLREDDAAELAAVAGARADQPAANNPEERLAPPPVIPAERPSAVASRAVPPGEMEEPTAVARELFTPSVAAVESRRERAARSVTPAEDDCLAARIALQVAPVVLECADLRSLDRDSVEGVEVFWVAQVARGNDVLLAVVPASQVTPELSDNVVDEITERSANVTVATRERAGRARPNVVSLSVGDYRVWLAGSPSMEELRSIGTTLISR